MNILNSQQVSARSLPQSGMVEINKLIDSDTLFKHGDVVIILHKGEQYALRRTRNGKLILNK